MPIISFLKSKKNDQIFMKFDYGLIFSLLYQFNHYELSFHSG